MGRKLRDKVNCLSFVAPTLLGFIQLRVTSRTSKNIQYLEAPSHFSLDEVARALESLVVILFEDSGMVFLGVLAALDHKHDQVIELGVGITGIVNMCWRL